MILFPFSLERYAEWSQAARALIAKFNLTFGEGMDKLLSNDRYETNNVSRMFNGHQSSIIK